MIINQKERDILGNLDQIMKDPNIQTMLNSLIEKAKSENTFPVTKSVPFDLFKGKLPKEINLCRIFLLPANTKSKIERHTNSFQRTVTVSGLGDTKILANNMWVSNMRSADGKAVEDRWLSVPENTWHQPISGKEDWITVTFHTASEKDIIDEYKD